jgi:hypothetical protein
MRPRQGRIGLEAGWFFLTPVFSDQIAACPAPSGITMQHGIRKRAHRNI